MPCDGGAIAVGGDGEAALTRVVREVRQRGVMGWLFPILFYGVNLYFAWALVRGLAAVAHHLNDHTASKAAQVGAAIGVAL